MAKVFVVQLSQSERQHLEGMLKKGKLSARKLKRAQMLLAANAGQTDERIGRLWRAWKTFLTCMPKRTIRCFRLYVLTSPPTNSSVTRANRYPLNRENGDATIIITGEKACVTCLGSSAPAALATYHRDRPTHQSRFCLADA